MLYVVAAIALSAIALNAMAYIVMDGDRASQQRRAVALVRLTESMETLQSSLAEQQLAIADHLASAAPAAADRYDVARDAEAAAFEALRADAGVAPAFDAYLRVLEGDVLDWRTQYADPAFQAIAAGSPLGSAALAADGARARAPVSRDVDAMREFLRGARQEVVAQTDQLAFVRSASTALQLALGVAATFAGLWMVRRYSRGVGREAERSDVLNRFTESTAFATDDRAVAASNLEALALLVHPDAAVTHLLNRSADRASPEVSLGAAVAEVLPLNALSRCPGVIRGSAYVTNDASQPLGVRCPVYPVDHGTLACIPLDSGEPVGAVHLAWEAPNAFPLEHRAAVSRVVDHAALAIGNRRLLAALQGQASTDARTGLANSRTFDLACEQELRSSSHDRPFAVLMLDLDNFKDFNDRHGHPAGDEALRVFAAILRTSVRDHDVAARYGGEEFAVLLPGLDAWMAQEVAERIRVRTESTLINLGPGITDRVTVSIGVAAAPRDGLQPVGLMRTADEALYRAKAAGRNRVCQPSGMDDAADDAREPAALATAG